MRKEKAFSMKRPGTQKTEYASSWLPGLFIESFGVRVLSC
jgi:hypothetical protein